MSTFLFYLFIDLHSIQSTIKRSRPQRLIGRQLACKGKSHDKKKKSNNTYIKSIIYYCIVKRI